MKQTPLLTTYEKFILSIVIILIGIFLAGTLAEAEERPTLILGGVSHHFFTEDYTNSSHNVLAIEYRNVIAGYMKNSYDNDSFVLAYSGKLYSGELVNIGLYLGAVRGYDKCFGKFTPEEEGDDKAEACPFIAPQININTGYNLKPQLTLFGDALVLSARYEF